jgi:hypothetical protein
MLATAKAIQVVNQLRAEGYISQYAVGGAIGALFYIEPTQTQDIDIFVHLKPAPGSVLISLNPILTRLKELGYALWEEDKIVVEGWPIQFLPATKKIEMEAIEHALEQPLADGVNSFVPPPEYLMVIAIDLGRPKDIIRLQQFYMEGVYEPAKLNALLKKHGLTEKWQKYLALFKASGESYGSELATN